VRYVIRCAAYLAMGRTISREPYKTNDRGQGACPLRGVGQSPTVLEVEMRIDKYLKISRIIKRRTVANEACDAGRVKLNDKAVKASAEVREGDRIEIQFGNKNSKYEVLQIKEVVRKEDAGLMYRTLE